MSLLRTHNSTLLLLRVNFTPYLLLQNFLNLHNRFRPSSQKNNAPRKRIKTDIIILFIGD